MRRHDIEPPLTHAINEDGDIKYVLDVPNGSECKCHCQKCNELLIAKHGHKVKNGHGRIPHFAHKSGTVCKGAQMSIMHLKAQRIIDERKVVRAPQYNGINARDLKFVYTNLEERKEWEGIKPDVYGLTADGKKWAIEIYYTNKINNNKEEKIKKLGVSCLEIDISKQSFDNLENFLLNDSNNRWWVNNPNDDELLPELESIFRVETPVPDYIYNPRKIKVQQINNYRFKIPDSCHSLAEYYLHLKSRKTFIFDGRRHNIIELAYSPKLEKLCIFHKDGSTFSYLNVTCVYADSEGNILEDTIESSRDIPSLLEAIKEDWRLEENELEDDDLPFPKQDDNIMSF